MNTVNTSIKHHILIGIFLCIWSFLFAFFARPFEHGNMDLRVWINVSLGFSLLAFFSYLFVSWIQKLIYERKSIWNIYYEIGFYILFYVVYALSTYLYYKGSLVNGNYDFGEFLVKIIFNIILIFSPILFMARRYAARIIPVKVENEDLTIKGDNKLDILKIKKSELICISNSQNYVEIFYLENGQVKKKLIRSSLKKMQSEFEFLLQIHRSHLINPGHFKSWKDSNTILLTGTELPVSKNYKDRLLAL